MRTGWRWALGAGLAAAAFSCACARVELREARQAGSAYAPMGIESAETELLAGRKAVTRAKALKQFHDAALTASTVLIQGREAGASERRRAVEIHNEAIERFLRLSKAGKRNLDADWTAEMNALGIVTRVEAPGDVWDPAHHDRLEFSSDHRTWPLREVYRRDGFGVAMFSVRRRDSNDPTRLVGDDRFLSPWEVHPVTLFMQPEPGGGSSIRVVDAFDEESVTTPTGRLDLAHDFSTPLAYHFARSVFPISEQIKRLDPDHLEWSAGLHMLHPYEPGKIPIVFVHGYWSSPRCWLQTINELRGDPALRSRYQFWIYTYPSMNPYLHSAALLRRSLREARRTFDPAGTDPAFGRMVVVGHSLGGILAKTLVKDGSDELWSLVSHKPLAEIVANDQQREVLEEVFFPHAESDVARVVYISTPHRGSPWSNRFVGRVSAALTPHPGPLADVYDQIKKENPPDVFTPLFREEGLATSFDQLRVGDPVLDVLDRLPNAPWVRTHSIIAQKHPGPPERGHDGIVRHESSHLDDVESELIVRHHHFVQGEPETIRELKRILTLHR